MALRRYLTLGGIQTEDIYCPDWYPIIQAAKYLNVAPWELLAQSIYWRDKALIAMTAERQSAKILSGR